jgi:hypothetical protein
MTELDDREPDLGSDSESASESDSDGISDATDTNSERRRQIVCKIDPDDSQLDDVPETW